MAEAAEAEMSVPAGGGPVSVGGSGAETLMVVPGGGKLTPAPATPPLAPPPAPATVADWEGQLQLACRGLSGVSLLEDSLVAHEMRWPDAGTFWEVSKTTLKTRSFHVPPNVVILMQGNVLHPLPPAPPPYPPRSSLPPLLLPPSPHVR